MVILRLNRTFFYWMKYFLFFVFLISILSCSSFESTEKKAWKELNQKAYFNYKSGNYYQGVEWMEKACDYATEHFGPEHPDTLSSMNNLIMFYMEQGRKTDIEPLLIKLINASTKTFGEHHKFTLACMDRLAAYYVTSGQLTKALSLYDQLLDAKKKELGANHPAIRNILINQAAIYSGLKNLDQAEKKFYEIIHFKISNDKKNEKKAIDDVPLTARLDLARLYESQQKIELAEKQYRYVYEFYRDQKGENDDDTLKAMHYLAQLYGLSSTQEKALQLYEQGYDICQKNRSSTDPLLFIFQKNRAILRVQLKKGELAETAITEVLEKSMDAYGQYDPNTIMLLYYSGIQHENMGKTKQAEMIFETVLTNAKAIFGETHLMTETIAKHINDFKHQYHVQ